MSHSDYLICIFLHFLIAPLLFFNFLKSIFTEEQDEKYNFWLSFVFGPIFFALALYYIMMFTSVNASGIKLVAVLSTVTGIVGSVRNRFNFFRNFSRVQVLIGTLLLVISPLIYHLTPLGHDFAEYCLFSETLASHKSVNFDNYWYNEKSHFYYVGLHGFGFPLLGYYEASQSLNYGIENVYFTLKFTHVYYTILLIITGYFFFEKSDKRLFSYYLFFLCLSFLFLNTLTTIHIDTIRITTFLNCLLIIYLLIRKNLSRNYIYALSFMCGLAAFVHSINAILLGIFTGLTICLIDFKISRFTVTCFLFIIGGFIHYILDIFLGRGWIFDNIKFY